MSEFLTLKMIPLALALALIKTRSFRTIGQKMLIIHENLEFSMAWENLPLKKGIFWPMGQKDGIFVLINSRANGKFRVKNQSSPYEAFFLENPVYDLDVMKTQTCFFSSPVMQKGRIFSIRWIGHILKAKLSNLLQLAT